jgi:sugar/nucleoside kinase (ribokinase family)
MTHRWDILGLGVTTVDDLLYVSSFPVPDTKMQVLRRERQGGGLTATALVAAARLGARCGYAGVMGYDEISAFVEQDLAHEGIDTSLIVRRDDARPIHAIIIVDQTAHTRTILFSADGRAGAADDLPHEDVIRASRLLFVDDYGAIGNVRAARIAREAGIPIVADFERPEWPGFAEVTPLVDHLILSARVAMKATGAPNPPQAARELWRPDRAVVVVTCGAEGCWYMDAGLTPRHQDSFSVDVVDTTGCGDVFHGAYAWTLVQGLPLPERIRIASATAALKATQPGGRRGIPNWERVGQFLQSQRL